MKPRSLFILFIILIMSLTLWQSYGSRFGSFESRTIQDINYSRDGEFMVYSMADGSVFVQGRNLFDQLAQGPNGQEFYENPVSVMNYDQQGILSSVVLATVGDFHVSVLLEDGYVLSWGHYQGDDGSYYHGNIPNPIQKSENEFLNNIISIKGNDSQTLALDMEGHLWGWGIGSLIDPFNHYSLTPYAIPILGPDLEPLGGIIDFSITNDFVVVLRKTNSLETGPLVEVIAWGDNIPGTDGTPKTPHVLYGGVGKLNFEGVFAGEQSIVLLTETVGTIEITYNMYILKTNENYLESISDMGPQMIYTTNYPFVYLGSTFIVVADNGGVMLYQGIIGSRDPADSWTLLDSNHLITAVSEGESSSLYVVIDNQLKLIE